MPSKVEAGRAALKDGMASIEAGRPQHLRPDRCDRDSTTRCRPRRARPADRRDGRASPRPCTTSRCSRTHWSNWSTRSTPASPRSTAGTAMSVASRPTCRSCADAVVEAARAALRRDRTADRSAERPLRRTRSGPQHRAARGAGAPAGGAHGPDRRAADGHRPRCRASSEPTPDLESLADLVAIRTSQAVAHGSAMASTGLSTEGLNEIEARMSRVVKAATARNEAAEDFDGVRKSINEVNERLARMEASLTGRAEAGRSHRDRRAPWRRCRPPRRRLPPSPKHRRDAAMRCRPTPPTTRR